MSWHQNIHKSLVIHTYWNGARCKALMAIVSLSICCSSVSPVPDHRSRIEGHSKMKLYCQEAFGRHGLSWSNIQKSRPAKQDRKLLSEINENYSL